MGQQGVVGETVFSRGDTVRLRSNDQRVGLIKDGPRTHRTGTDYRVFFAADDIKWLAGSLLEAVSDNVDEVIRAISGVDLLRDIALAKVLHPLNDALYAYGASRTDFAVYQFRPVLKFLRGWMNGTPGLLIADEVGLGKTIEAAIILQELKARVDVQRAIVLCPSRLTSKWQDELSNRFSEYFTVLDASSTRRLLEDVRRNGPATRFKVIASFEMLRRAEFLEQLTEANVPIDYLVIDEAHHLRNSGTRTHRLGEALADGADAMVLLSATPMHLGPQDLFNLLKLVAPQDFEELTFFDAILAPNRFLNEASRAIEHGDATSALRALKGVETTNLRARYTHNANYHDVVSRLSHLNSDVSTEDRVAIQHDLNNLNTLADALTRTKKREFTDAAIREAHSVIIDLTPIERQLYNAVMHQTRKRLEATGRDARGFATIMRERQAASCLPAMRQQLAELSSAPNKRVALGYEQSSLDASFLPGDDAPDDVSFADGMLRTDRVSLTQLAAQLGDCDSKYHQLHHILQTVLNEDSGRKVLLFSFFRHTIDYLAERLRANGVGIEVLHGGIKPVVRQRVIERFRTEDEIRVLLSSEVGAEGLDFQFCDVLVNYDLPWNPMQVEQRIGRLDRFGQQAEKIRIYNFFLNDTIETRIFERLYNRIQLFTQSIGDLEAILGNAIRDLRLEVLRPDLTAEQERRLADQTVLRIVRERQEQERFAGQEAALLGQSNLLDQRIDATIQSGHVIVPSELAALVSTFFAAEFPPTVYSPDGDAPCATLSFDARLGARLDPYLEALRVPYDTPLVQARAGNNRIALTFSSELAQKRPTLEFVTIHHPIAQMAIDHWREAHRLRGGTPPRPALLSIDGPPDEAGPAWFFIYSVAVQAVTTSQRLETIVLRDQDGMPLPQTQFQFLRHVQRPSPRATTQHDEDTIDGAEWDYWQDRAADVIAALRDEIEAEARSKNTDRIERRRAAIEASVAAKVARLSDRAEKAGDERILRMTDSMIRNVQSRMTRDIERLERQRDVIVSYQLIAGGRVLIHTDTPLEADQSTTTQSATGMRSLMRNWIRR